MASSHSITDYLTGNNVTEGSDSGDDVVLVDERPESTAANPANPPAGATVAEQADRAGSSPPPQQQVNLEDYGNSRKNMKSVLYLKCGWKRRNDINAALCPEYNEEVSIGKSSNTTNLLNHLRQYHPELYKIAMALRDGISDKAGVGADQAGVQGKITDSIK